MTTPITVSLEKAKELKEAGYPQFDTIFSWIKYSNCEPDLLERSSLREGVFHDWQIAAPTAEEILRRLPGHLVFDEKLPPFILYARALNNPIGHPHLTAQWTLYYAHFVDGKEIRGDTVLIGQDTLANAAAVLYCHLATHNLL